MFLANKIALQTNNFIDSFHIKKKNFLIKIHKNCRKISKLKNCEKQKYASYEYHKSRA